MTLDEYLAGSHAVSADDNGELLCSLPSDEQHQQAPSARTHPQFMRLPDYELQEITD